MEIKVQLFRNGQHLFYVIRPKDRTTYHARLLNDTSATKTVQKNIEIYCVGMNWESNCPDALLALELSTAIRTTLN